MRLITSSLAYLHGTWLLFHFFLGHLSTMRSLPFWLRNPPLLDEFVKKQADEKRKKNNKPSPLVLSVPNAPRHSYDKDFKLLKQKLRNLHQDQAPVFTYKATLVLLFTLRIFVCWIAWTTGSAVLTILTSAIQFLLAPYSLFVSFALAFTMGPPHFIGHYFVNAAVGMLLQLTSVTSSANEIFSFQITPSFVALFFVFDFLLCCWCHYSLDTRPDPTKKTLIHIVFGFLNCKTYYVVLFGLLVFSNNSEYRLRLLPWLVDWMFGLTPRISTLVSHSCMHWSEIFYIQHRMAHLPKVYEDAHKIHHHLHGSTAFDAHIYGNGMPEEFFLLCIDIIATCMFGLTPASLNHHILWHSWTNKMGHTEQKKETGGNNFHPDHHIYHRKNYGIYNCLFDIYFGTAVDRDQYNYRVGLYITDTGESGGMKTKEREEEVEKMNGERRFLINVKIDEKSTHFLLFPYRGYW